MDIKALETHRISDRVHLDFSDKANVVIYDRYVDAADWDADPQAVIAEVAKFLSERSVEPEIIPSIGTKPISMTDADVAAKLAEMATAEAALNNDHIDE